MVSIKVNLISASSLNDTLAMAPVSVLPV